MFKKTIAVIIAVIIVTCVFASCAQPAAEQTATEQTRETSEPAEEEITGMPNPMVEVNSPDEFINLLPAPSGTTVVSCYIINDEIDDLTFTDEEGNEYNARAAMNEECEDPEMLTGLNGVWTYQEGMGDIRYATVQIDSDEYYVAYWQKIDNDETKTFYTLAGPKSCEYKITAYAEEICNPQ